MEIEAPLQATVKPEKSDYWAMSSDYALSAGVYGVVGSIYISRAGYEISIGLLAYAVLANIKHIRDSFSMSTTDLLMAGYLLSAIMSVVFASYPRYALPFLWKTLPDMVVLYLAGLLFLNPTNASFNRRVHVLLLISLVVVSLVGFDGVYQFIAGRDVKGNLPDGPRLTAVFGNPNEFHYIVPLIFGGMLAVKVIKSRACRWAACAGLAALGFTVINTQSMAVLFCIFGTMCIYGIYRRSYISVIIMLVVAAMFTGLVASDELAGISRFNHVFSRESAAVSLSNRWDVWKMSWEKFLERPVIGHGPGLFNPEFDTLKEQGRYGVRTVLIHSHNIYLQTLAEKGLVGAFFFLALFYNVLRKALGRFKYAPSMEHGLALLFVLGSLTAICLSGMADMDIGNWRFNSMWSLMLSFGAVLTKSSISVAEAREPAVRFAI
jgi:O-antigen ligase